MKATKWVEMVRRYPLNAKTSLRVQRKTFDKKKDREKRRVITVDHIILRFFKLSI